MLRGSLKWALWCAAGTMLAACGSAPQHTGAVSSPSYAGGGSHGYYKVGKPYKIEGVWYYPKEDWSYDQTGIASWYGEQFHGRYTADGETFDLNTLTAAHRTLPMPTVVTVTNLDNGRSIKLRVNDRGPYARGRIIDVSRRAAQMLGFEGAGTAKVRVTIDAQESFKVAAAAGRNGGGVAPSPVAMVAAVIAAPIALPVSAIEAMRAGAMQPAPAPTPPSPAPAEVKLAASSPPPVPREPVTAAPIAVPQSASPPVSTTATPVAAAPKPLPVEARPLLPPPAETRPVPTQAVRVAQARPFSPPSRPVDRAVERPVRVVDNEPMAVAPPPPQPRRSAEARPYLIDDLPGEDQVVAAFSAPAPAAPPPLPAKVEMKPVHPSQIFVQAGAFTDHDNAIRLQGRLRALGSPVTVTAAASAAGNSVYRVRVGPMPSVDAADTMLNQVVSDGEAGARIVVD